MRRSLFFVALTISLMAAIVASIFTVLQDRESAQAAAAVVDPPAAQLESAALWTAVDESADRRFESVSATSAPDHYTRGDGSGISADHDGELCPFKDTNLRDSEL